MENHHFEQVNHLFLWAMFHGYVKKPEGINITNQSWDVMGFDHTR
jgi:hypothetical protein